jgi:acyl dehydratase
MSGRFSRPVLPGEPLTVSIWLTGDGETALFQTTRTDGTVVIDRGRCSSARRRLCDLGVPSPSSQRQEEQ